MLRRHSHVFVSEYSNRFTRVVEWPAFMHSRTDSTTSWHLRLHNDFISTCYRSHAIALSTRCQDCLEFSVKMRELIISFYSVS